MVVPGFAPVVKDHIQHGGRGWDGNDRLPGASVLSRHGGHGGVSEAVPVIGTPTHGYTVRRHCQGTIIGDGGKLVTGGELDRRRPQCA
jgi:hypothetical protein